jgi:DNA-binding NarL/FixJ family response regulator
MLQAHREMVNDLTECERTIIELLAQGQTINGIGRTICLSAANVSRQILICRHKMDARNNVELVANAVSSGLFD